MSDKELVAGEDYYKDSYDTFGFEEPTWSPNNVKLLLRSLIEGKILQEMDNAALLSFLYRNKLLNLSNRHKDFFKKLIPASKTKGGFEAISKYAYSDSENPPSLEHYQQVLNTNSESEEEQVKTLTDDEISEERFDPLKNRKLESIEDVIRQTESVNALLDQINKTGSISVDKEAMEFYLNYAVNKYWRKIFENEEETIAFLKKLKPTGNKFRDVALNTFLRQYDQSQKLKIPPISRTHIKLSPMQRYVALMVKNKKYFGNFSGTGAGKTLAAIISSRVIDSKMTLVICPNDVVDYWESELKIIYPDSIVKTKNDAFDAKYNSDKHQYLILNWDKLNQKTLVNHLIKLGKQHIDFVILDEIHFTKNEDSSRRENLAGLLTNAKRKNPDLKLLGMTATPIVNKLQEGKSLLELITGIQFEDLKTQPYVGNAVALYEKFTNLSIRQLPSYEKASYEFAEVEAPLPNGEVIAQLKGKPLAIEQLLTEARIPEILKRIKGPTIIYTEYVGSALTGKDDIVDILGNAMETAKLSYGFYTGENHEGLEKFKNGEIQVLIASRPIAVGVDGLQKVCNNLIFNTLPWTNAQYRQIIGRLVRQGQTKTKVHIHHIKASFPGVLYDEFKKLARINWKRALSDCAVDGHLPEGVLVTPEQATKEAVKWLERLEKGEISVVSRRLLEVELTPVEIETRLRKYGQFSKLNQKMNTENSSTTHARFTKDPEEFLEYHRQYAEQRKTWDIIPYEYWIKRLRSLSENNIIGDFGCGEAKIGQDPKLSGRVKSFDHVSVGDFTKVTPCDVSDVSEYVKSGSLNVVVFSLSLMAKNWRDYLKEAHRCLAEYGLIFISETTNQVEERLSDLREELDKIGFKIQKDDQKSLFTFIEAIKLGEK